MYARRTETRTILAVVVTFLVAASQGRAMAGEWSPESNSKWLWSVNGGAGIGFGAGNNFGDDIALTTGVTGMKGHRLLAARYSRVERVCFGFACNSLWDAGLMYGFVARNSVGMATISAGLAVTGGTNFSGAAHGWGPLKASGSVEHAIGTETFTTVGIPIEAKLTWTLGSYVGMSAGGFADVNMERSFGGFIFGLSLGRLR